MSSSPSNPAVDFPTITIVGVGLIGGSIAAAVNQRKLAERVIGVGRNAVKLEGAIQTGLIDEATEDLAAAAAKSNLILFCTPVDRIAEGVLTAASHCRPGTVLSDGGSVKESIYAAIGNALPEGVHFIGAHPLAGSEKQGFEFSNPDLFEGRVCVITQQADDDPDAVERISKIWRQLGSSVVNMSPRAHDEALAETSHLPHLVASALASTLRESNRDFTASGFRDTTRIAAGDEHLWTAIFQANTPALIQSLDRFEERLGVLREALADGNTQKLQQILRDARLQRESL